MLNGELVSAYIWWEGKEDWNQILSTNTWPPETETATAWTVRNTGDEAAVFKVAFMGLESAGALLDPGEEATLYLYPVTPSVGSYDYTLEVIADGEVVVEYPIQVITGEAMVLWPLAIAVGVGVLGVGAAVAVALAAPKPKE